MVPSASSGTLGRDRSDTVAIRAHLTLAYMVRFARIVADLARHQPTLCCEGGNGVPFVVEPQSAFAPRCRRNEAIGIDAVTEQSHGCGLFPRMKLQIPGSAIPDRVEKGDRFLDAPQEPYACTGTLFFVPPVPDQGLVLIFSEQRGGIDGIVENDRVRVNPENVVITVEKALQEEDFAPCWSAIRNCLFSAHDDVVTVSFAKAAEGVKALVEHRLHRPCPDRRQCLASHLFASLVVPRRGGEPEDTTYIAASSSTMSRAPGRDRDLVARPNKVGHAFSAMTWAAQSWNGLAAVAKKRSFGWTCLAFVVGPTALLFLLASSSGSTFTGAVPDGVSAPSVFRQAAQALGIGHLTSPRAAELAYVLIAVACLGFLGVLLASRHGGVTTRAVVGWSVGLIALACIGPPLFSHDLFGYAIYGRLLVFHHANPYVQTPSAAPHDLFYPYNPWTHYRSPYGPGFTDIAAALVWVFRSAAATVAAFKTLSGICWVGTVLLAARLGRRWGPTAACFAAAVIGLNPVVIFRIVAGGHGDALVALAVIAALTAWYDARRLLVTVILTFAMLVKIVAVIPLLIFLVASIRAVPTTPDRMKKLGQHLAVIVALSIVALLPFGYTPSVLSANLNQGTLSGGSLRPPEVMIAARAGSLLRHVGLSQHVALSNRVIEALFLGVAALAFLFLLRRNETRPVPERVLLALLIFLLCSPWLEPWYLAWFIPIIGFVTRRTVVAVAVALSLIASESLVTQLTSGLVLHTLARLSYDVYPILGLGLLIVLLVELVRPVRRKSTVGKHASTDERVPDYVEAS